jgi:methyl coenzyme M reductase gamma subunit
MLDAKGKPMVEVEFVALRANGIEDMPEGRDPEGVACEYAAAEAYIRQHPIMGTMDPNSTDAKATSYLLGVVEWGDNIAHAEQSDSWELLDRSLLPADRQHVELSNIPGARRKPNSKSVNAARVEANRRRDMHMALSRREVGSGVFDPAGMGIRGYRQPGEK